MNGLREDDYRELFNYIKERLAASEADDLVQQLQDLETVSIIEELDTKPSKLKRKREQPIEEQIGMEFNSLEDLPAQYRFRSMSGKELYCAAIDMLETRLVSGPEMAAAIRKALWGDDGTPNEIVWKYENADRSDDLVDSIKELSKMSAEVWKDVKEIIFVLKNVSGEETA